ncbi:CLUMA_CG010463, isoform A [Clunio marinus]|uniref:CLUMA_CG010463, isoform A n=1 Tax=Clunio marinus TaxID=568069 RepID=A0A1J1I9V2_9DIPT|nr:CLUMA_CG010463, isoform A [Clunio marinus]
MTKFEEENSTSKHRENFISTNVIELFRKRISSDASFKFVIWTSKHHPNLLLQLMTSLENSRHESILW